MASTGQASAQLPQRMHSDLSTLTPPPLRCENAPVGQAVAHGAGLHATHVRASNPVERPPAEEILIPAVFHESLLCTRRAQASEQE
jgi:hypothetical protein